MDTAQRRVLGLVAVASWLLIDAIRTSGPLLSGLTDTSTVLAASAALATFAAGGILAWIAAHAGGHFGHGVVVMFLLAVVGIARMGLPLLNGGWLIAAGLYLAALTLATLVLTARVALGNGGGAALLAGTSLGAAAAVAEQTVLRTWDAVWREDLLGWVALATVAALAVLSGWRSMRLEPVASSRGWWAYGLLWSLLASTFANVSWLNAQTGLRMSSTALVTVVSLSTAALLAGQARATSRVVVTVLGVAGLGALSVLMLRTGPAAAIALPIAVAVTSLCTARVMRGAVSSSARRLAAATVMGLAIVVPLLLVQAGGLPVIASSPTVVMVASGAAVIVGAVWRAWSPAPTASPREDSEAAPESAAALPTRWISPGVPLRAVAGFVAAAALAAWTFTTYEAPRTLSKDFLLAPSTMSWSLGGGLQPRITGGPDVRLDQVAATISDAKADVVMLQDVSRGGLDTGGADMLEYLAGELRLPYAAAGAAAPQQANVIMTSRAHAEPRSIVLPAGEGSRERGAVAVDFMGATFASTALDSADAGGQAQATALAAWLDEPQPLVIGGDLGDVPSTGTLTLLADAGFVSAQDALGTEGVTYLGTDPSGAEAIKRDYLLGRGVEFTSFETLGVPWSGHLALLARATTGASAPTEPGEDVNATQPEAGTSPSPSPTASVSPSPTPSPSSSAGQ